MSDTVENSSLLAPSANPDLRWYVVHAYSGMEKAVERNITERIQRAGPFPRVKGSRIELLQTQTVGGAKEVLVITRRIDHVTISPLGDYFLASFDLACQPGELGSEAQPCGLMVYDADLGSGRGLLRVHGHRHGARQPRGAEPGRHPPRDVCSPSPHDQNASPIEKWNSQRRESVMRNAPSFHPTSMRNGPSGDL